MDAGASVLHVDDDPDLAAMVAEMLERNSDAVEVYTEYSGEEALDRLTGGNGVDCVVSDYDMPGMDGLELLDEVRSTDPDLPFVLYTGHGSEEVASEAISSGATDYVQKEGSLQHYEVLARRVENAVSKRRADELAEERDSLAALAQVCANLVACGTAAVACEYAVDTAAFVLGFDACSATVPGEDGPVSAAAGDVSTPGGATRAVLDDGLAARTRRSNESRIVGGANGNCPVDGFGAAVSVPVGDEGGVLQAAAVDAEGFDRSDLELAELLADHLAAVVEHAVGPATTGADSPAPDAVGPAEDPDEHAADADALIEDAEAESGPALPADDPDGLDGTDDVDGAGDGRVDGDEDLDVDWTVDRGASVEDRPRTVVEALPDPVAVCRDGRVEFAADGFLDRLGHDREAVADAPLAGFVRPEDADRVAATLDDPDHSPVEVYVQTPDGPRLHDLRVREVPVGDGTTRLCSLRDLGDRDERRALERRAAHLAGLADAVTREPLTVTREPDAEDRAATLELGDLAESAWSSVETGDATLAVGDAPRVNADRRWVGTLLETLFRTAVSAGGPESAVRVFALRGGFAVAVDGGGAREPGSADRCSIVDGASATAEVGVTIARAVAEEHGLSLSVVEGDGGGLRFEVTDPRAGRRERTE